MNPKERKTFEDTILHEQGLIPYGSGSVSFRASKGENVLGFAIEPETLESCESSGYGSHELAFYALKTRIRSIRLTLQQLGQSNQGPDPFSIIRGLVFTKVPGFKNKIVLIFGDEISEQHRSKISRHLLSVKKYIPIDFTHNVLE